MVEFDHDLQKQPEKKNLKKRVLKEAGEWIRSFFFAAVVMLFVTMLIGFPARVQGSSMSNTLHDKEFMIVTRYQYLFADPERFDVVICRYPGRGNTNFVKRVVGLPGDTVSIQNKTLYVNGEPVEEDYIDYPSESMPEVTVEEGHYFVLGDNRSSSNDSRYVGQLTRSQIIGKVRLVAWPLGEIRLIQ